MEKNYNCRTEIEEKVNIMTRVISKRENTKDVDLLTLKGGTMEDRR